MMLSSRYRTRASRAVLPQIRAGRRIEVVKRADKRFVIRGHP